MSNPHREMTIAEESAPERAWRVLPVSVTPDYSSGPKCPWCGAEGLSHGLFRWTRVKRGRYAAADAGSSSSARSCAPRRWRTATRTAANADATGLSASRKCKSPRERCRPHEPRFLQRTERPM